jgi:PilZ domain
MTPDMAFECLLVSRDPQVICTLNRVLDNLSISTKHYLSPGKALTELRASSADLVVIDWEEDHSASDLLYEIQRSDITRKKTVLAVSAVDRRIPGTHFLLRKPVTAETGAHSLKCVYSRMLQDYRRYARYAVLTPVIATRGDNQLVPVTITNIGDGGIGLSSRETLVVGDILSFRVLLSGARRAIYIEARVLWTREYGVSGCEFIRIPPVDLDILHDWLKSKCQIKKPFVVL